jgi:hypothetical protein
MQILRFPMAAILLSLAAATASADEEQVLSREPPTGALHAGQKALVDDGTCPQGQVKEVTIGRTDKRGPARQRRCVADPRANQ